MALIDNLVSYYKFDENAGSTVSDSVGSQNGTWAGTLGAQWATGRINSGGNFDFNSSSYVSGMNPGINANSFSISFWTAPGTQVGMDSTINFGYQDFLAIDSGAGNRMVLEINGVGATTVGSVFLFTQVGFAGSGSVSNSTDLRNNGFHHIVLAASTSNNNVTLYVDNIAVSTNTWTVISTITTNFLLGNRSTTDNRNITAVMDEVGVWSRPLTASEVSQLYNKGAGLQYPFTVPIILMQGNAPQPFLKQDIIMY